MMQARDAAGRLVCLLRDDGYERVSPDEPEPRRPLLRPTALKSDPIAPRSPSVTSTSIGTLESLRPKSHDVYMNGERFISPLTPSADFVCARAGEYHPMNAPGTRHAIRVERSTSTGGSCTSPTAKAPGVPVKQSGKRFLCRYRDSHGCRKTFTTSSHASRHSKIHMARATIPCAYNGCPKRFTRADNMKQHLVTRHRSESCRSGAAASRRQDYPVGTA